MISPSCYLASATEELSLNNLVQGQEPHATQLIATPRSTTQSSPLSPPFLKNMAASFPSSSPFLFDDVGFAPLLPDMFALEGQDAPREMRAPRFKVQPRFASLRTVCTFPVQAMSVPPFVMDPVSSDEEGEGGAPSDSESTTSSLEDHLASLTNMETARQERLDTMYSNNNKAKIAPKKKTMHMKQPVPQRPTIRVQPRRNSLSAIAA